MTHLKHLVLLILLIISNTSCIQGNTADTKNKNSAEKKGEIMTIEQDMVSYIKKGNLKKVQQYIEKTSVDIYARGNDTDRDDWTALIWAVYYEQFEIVKYLVDTSVTSVQQGWRRANGVDVNIQDEDTYTALINASDYGYTEIVKVLVDTSVTSVQQGWRRANGADINIEDKNTGMTALVWASDYGYTEIVEYLKSHSVTSL